MIPMGRMVVRAQSASLYTAEADCTLELWPITEEIEDRPSTVVYIQWKKDSCTFNKGTPLEIGTTYSIPMKEGDTIYAVTRDLSEVGFMVKP